MVRAVDVHDDGRSAGYGGVAYAVVGDGHAVDHPERRIKAQAFLDDLGGELELGNVGVASTARRRALIKLLPTLSRQSGRELQKIEKPRQTVRRGLMAGDEELHALAEDELVAHAFAVAVACVHQGLEQVVAGRLAGGGVLMYSRRTASARVRISSCLRSSPEAGTRDSDRAATSAGR